jgi:hypothetical protein
MKSLFVISKQKHMKNKKLLELKNLIEMAEINLRQAQEIMAELVGGEDSAHLLARRLDLNQSQDGEEQIVEGVFNGVNMIGPDAKEYSVPANYASKSKLVEGDVLKLTIKPDGTFVYKQIKPQERERQKGKLLYDSEKDEYRALLDNGKSYKLIHASVTYFKGEPNDEVIILIPKGIEASQAALENVIKNGGDKGLSS